MITHITFLEEDKKKLEETISLDQGLEGEVVWMKDNFSVGPIRDIYTEEGIQQRSGWWQTVLAGGDAEYRLAEGWFNNQAEIKRLVEKMEEDETAILWIWMAPNSLDISGYYWIINYLKPFQGRVMVLYLNNLPFFNEKGNIFYPDFIHQIPAKEFLKARKLAREITISEFEVDPDEWQRLINEDKEVRIFEGGKKLGQAGVEYFDTDLKKHIMPDWQKASKIINQFSAKVKAAPDEAFLLWRLKEIISGGKVDVQGKPGNMKEFEIKQKQKTEAPSAIGE